MSFNRLSFTNRLFIKINSVRKNLRYLLIISFCHIISGCSIIGNIKYQGDFVYKEIQTDYFTVATWQKIDLSSNSSPYLIFIEGDGNSFNSYGYPTLNPTPKNSKLKKLAFKSKSNKIIYMARPCQFVRDEKCDQSHWTTARFSKEVIGSMAQAIKSMVGNNRVILVGYSGGAQVSGLIAVGDYNINITELITIGGNLDHKSWTKHHKISELSDSLDLNDYREEYLKIPQIHYVGEKDKVIPAFLIEKFVKKDKIKDGMTKNYVMDMGKSNTLNSNIPIVKIPKAGHVDILDKINL